MPHPRTLAVALAAATTFIVPATAHAASVDTTGGVLHVVAAPGEANVLAVALSGGTLTVTDTGAAARLSAATGCTLPQPGRVTCSATGVGAVDVRAGDGDDALTVTANLPARLDGGPGQDALTGGPAGDALDGGAGPDVLNGGGGRDVADYSARTEPVAVDLSAYGAVQGEPGEADRIGGDVEGATGGAGADVLTGDDNANTLAGGPGDDQLDGDGGADRLEGDDGFDTVDYSARRSNVYVDLDGNADDGQYGEGDDVRPDVERVLGGAGDDRLTGGPAPDQLAGNAGRDTLDGAGGDDALSGGDGDDTLKGGTGDDALDGAGGNDTISGNENDDRADGGAGNDTIAGNDGDDVLSGGDGSDMMTGNAGDDALDGGAADDTLNGGDGTDALSGADADDTLDAGAGDDTLAGGAGGDRMYAGDGDDRLDGADGDDDLHGGRGGDQLTGGAGDDRLSADDDADALDGGPGSDQLWGGAGDDQLAGGDDGDRLSGASGNDVLDGGAGPDVIAGDDGTDTVNYSMRTAALTVTIGAGTADDGEAGEHDDVQATVESVLGGAGDDHLTGTGAANLLDGGAGDDRLAGAPGDDVLLGDGGKDLLIGGPGRDGFDGGAGDDHLSSNDGVVETLVCGTGGKDVAVLDKADHPQKCETRKVRPPAAGGTSGPAARAPARRVVARRSWLRLAARSNVRLGGAPSVSTGLPAAPRCRGAGQLRSTWIAAGKAFGIRWSILAGITEIESNYGCNMGPSKAGAIGWTQFMPATWKHWGMDADGDHKASAYNSVDAIFSSARYLRASGAPRSYRKALFAYNHATWYVNGVLARARKYR